jgi:y4mF family transcriptional regulator
MFRSAGNFGAAIKQRRKFLGWTQTELARRSGTGERFIVELESGKPSCQLEKSLVVARTVGIEVGDLRTAEAALTISDDDLDFLRPSGTVDDVNLLGQCWRTT